MIKMKLDDNYALKSDENQFILCVIQEKKDGEYYKPHKFYRTIDGALKGYLDIKIQAGNEVLTNFKEIKDEINKLHKKIDKIKEELYSNE